MLGVVVCLGVGKLLKTDKAPVYSTLGVNLRHVKVKISKKKFRKIPINRHSKCSLPLGSNNKGRSRT